MTRVGMQGRLRSFACGINRQPQTKCESDHGGSTDADRDPRAVRQNQRSQSAAHASADRSAGAANSETLPTTVEVTSMAPSATPTRTGVRIYTRCRIHSRCRIDRVVFNHHSRRRYNDGAANHEDLGNDGSRLLDNNRRRSPVRVRPRIAFAVASYRQIGGHCRRGKSECTCTKD